MIRVRGGALASAETCDDGLPDKDCEASKGEIELLGTESLRADELQVVDGVNTEP
jgi:hypothetical protein